MPIRPAFVSAAGRITSVVAVVTCAVTLVFAYLNKARCAGPPFDADGRSEMFDRIKDSDVCYSDIQFLWLGRDINEHVFPYLTGAITPDGGLTGGAVEYPVLSGLLMWLGAVGAHDDAAFLLHSAVLLAPFALVTAWLLGRLSGFAALLWSMGTPLILYAFHNWELPVVCAAVAAVYVMVVPTGYTLRTRGMLAAVLLGIGFCLKVYPGIFVVPLAIHVLLGGDEPIRPRYDVRGALSVLGTALLTVVVINLPFAVGGFPGWRASIVFQQLRQADITTNSIWYWGLRPSFGDTSAGEATFQNIVSVLSPLLVLMAFLLALWLGWKRFRVTGSYPWVAVSGAMLCGFLLFHKVHSPQYTLWMIPFLVLLEVPWLAIAVYLLADAAIGVGVFRYFHLLGSGAPTDLAKSVVEFGVWGQASMLVFFFVTFLRAGTRTGWVRSRPEIARGAAELIRSVP